MKLSTALAEALGLLAKEVTRRGLRSQVLGSRSNGRRAANSWSEEAARLLLATVPSASAIATAASRRPEHPRTTSELASTFARSPMALASEPKPGAPDRTATMARP